MGANANKEEDWVHPDFSFECSEDVSFIKLTPNREIVAVGYGSHNIRLFNLANKQMLTNIEGCCYSKACGVVCSLDFSPDSRFMAYRWNSEVRILDLSSLQMVKSINNENESVCINFSPNGNFLLTGNYKDRIKVLDLTCDSSVALKVDIKGRT